MPSDYPNEAWYRYADLTCEYDCQIGEDLYWTPTPHLGAQTDANHFEEIQHDWHLNTPE